MKQESKAQSPPTTAGAPPAAGRERHPRAATTQDSPESLAAVESWHRRRAASWRFEPLVCGHRDPLSCRAAEPIPDVDQRGARAAWAHLAALGLSSEVVDAVLGIAA